MPIRSIPVVTVLSAALGITSESVALAQLPFGLEEHDAIGLRPGVGPDDFVELPSAGWPELLAPRFALSVSHEHRPLVIRTYCEDPTVYFDCDVVAEQQPVVEHLSGAQVQAAITPGARWLLAVSVPVLRSAGRGLPVVYVDGSGARRADNRFTAGSSIGLGDPRLDARLRLMGGGSSPLSIALALDATAPLAQQLVRGRFLGDRGPSAGLTAIGELGVGPALRAAVQVGGSYRPAAEMVGYSVGPGLVYGAGLGWRPFPLLEVVAEVGGRTSFGAHTEQMEANGAARLAVGEAIAVLVGAGGGIVRGPGVPHWRAFGALSWTHRRAGDEDGDGVDDATDGCPAAAEDRDEWQDSDGCPDADDDGDGMADRRDRCPRRAEDADGTRDDDGCPDEDDDGDGVPDGYDSCQTAPEDRDGDRDDDGCPDLDTDRDGIQDPADACPAEAEDTDGLRDEDGCPEQDADGDGVPDTADECAEEAEDADGWEDENGCPEPESPPPSRPTRRRREQ
ncbi:MAG: thrombospondin type 3 repeat-containing protein [Myxococcota bacterium]|nr:thrombospondin type 3 repeat-containing protein [Myxococcota bacterium]MDW8361053.1 thrombospondin type 3 repeat-containing protein [Myxococcales bacterium]